MRSYRRVSTFSRTVDIGLGLALFAVGVFCGAAAVTEINLLSPYQAVFALASFGWGLVMITGFPALAWVAGEPLDEATTDLEK